MFNKIASTFFTKLISGLLNLGLVVLAAQFLGADGRGEISLLMLNITIIVLISEFSGGGTLIYLLPRFNFYQLLYPSYLWAILSAIAASFILTILNLSPENLKYDLIFISLLYCINGVHLNMLLGLERIRQHNLSSFLQIAGIAGSFVVFLFIFKKWEIQSYVNALYIGSFLSIITTSLFLFRDITKKKKKDLKNILSNLLSKGFLVQIGNIFQLLNYRLVYYFIEIFKGTFTLGIYSTGAALAEALWLISKSISMVQYARISNTEDLNYAKTLTVKLIKLSFLSTCSLLLFICLLPTSVYMLLFGEEFHQVKLVIQILSPGIASFSISNMLSHYFSGIGKFHVNSTSSAIGLIASLALGILLIPDLGIVGAAITGSSSYITSTLYQFTLFKKQTNLKLKELTLTKSDKDEAIKAFNVLLGKNLSSK